MGGERSLIVNADDFGLSAGTNRGIIAAHERGVVTSASLMVRPPSAAEAVAYSRGRSQLSVGLHVDLGEWVWSEGEWRPAYEVVPTEDIAAVSEEVERQLAAFRRLMGCDPTHLDSHQHVHKHEPARSVLLGLADQLEVPLRHFCRDVVYCGDFYGQGDKASAFSEGVSVENLVGILTNLSACITELGCHPGLDATLDSSYRTERLLEVRSLCDPRVREAIDAAGLKTISFRELAGRQPTR